MNPWPGAYDEEKSIDSTRWASRYNFHVANNVSGRPPFDSGSVYGYGALEFFFQLIEWSAGVAKKVLDKSRSRISASTSHRRSLES
jgi:hypothetical protein